MSYLRSLLAGPSRRSWNPSWLQEIARSGQGWGGWAGVPVTERAALQQLTVNSCVSLITETMSQLPVGAFLGKGPTREPLPDPQILTEPCAGMTWDEWLGQEQLSVLLRGNGYGEVVSRDGFGFPSQIMPLHPDECAPRLIEGREMYKVAGHKDLMASSDIFHIKGLSLPGVRHSLRGLSPIEYAANTIGTALAMEEYGARYFSEASVPPGYLTTEGEVDEDEAKDMQMRWVDSHGQRDRKPAVLAGGLKYETISIAPEEAQFLQSFKAKREEICGFYRVPPHMVGITEKSTSWGTGIEEQTLGYVTFTLGIWLVRWENALSRLLPKNRYVKFNVAGLLRGRLSQQFTAFLQGRQGGWLSIDDVRALLDMPPIPDGKGTDYLQPLNFGAIPPGGGLVPGEPEPLVTPVPDSGP